MIKDVDEDMGRYIELELRNKDLERELKRISKELDEIHWILERYHKVLCVLGDDYKKRIEPTMGGIVEGMYG